MKYILIAFFMNLSSPQEPAIMTHHSLPTKEMCEEVAQNMKKINDEATKGRIKLSVFCVSEVDLLELPIA